MLVPVSLLISSSIMTCVLPLVRIVAKLKPCLKQLTPISRELGQYCCSRFRQYCFIAGCNCYLLHLAASKGADAYYQVTGFNVEDHSVDIYYYFSKSTKRKGNFFDFVDLEWKEVEVCEHSVVIIREML